MEKSRLMLGFKLIFSLVICQFAGILGSFFTTPYVGSWYAFLEKPVFSPPNWVFAPVWTVLYLMMGLSLFIIWSNQENIKKVKTAIIYFAIQLVLNIVWSLVFFTFQSPLGAIFVIIALFVAILLTTIKFSKISDWAAFLMIPYLVWVGFAGILNITIFFLNK
mgnify:CR=1 FL=1|uniref:Tryptophan-rich sensory protein n=1 Tax=candidate division CPR3 bacterium TaxID=2268181 RepID=A0A7C4M0N1_UNCC3